MSPPRLHRSLPWREPWAVARALAADGAREGLVLLEGDGSPLGRRAVLGMAPLETVRCGGLPGDQGASDPFAALEALERRGGPWLGWLAYEAAAWVEPADHWQRSDMATLWAARHDPLIHFDRLERLCWLEGAEPARLAALVERLEALERRGGGGRGNRPRRRGNRGPGPGGHGADPPGGLALAHPLRSLRRRRGGPAAADRRRRSVSGQPHCLLRDLAAAAGRSAGALRQVALALPRPLCRPGDRQRRGGGG
ncbi:MAG: hypothetical protein ACO3B3_09470, partial [Cyanobium sp.]